MKTATISLTHSQHEALVEMLNDVPLMQKTVEKVLLTRATFNDVELAHAFAIDATTAEQNRRRAAGRKGATPAHSSIVRKLSAEVKR